MIVVHAFHVVHEIPVSWKSVPRDSAIATFVGAQIWFVAMTMHGVGLTLMAEKTGSGGKPGIGTGLILAPVRFQMGIHKFAGRFQPRLVGLKEKGGMEKTREVPYS